MDADERRSAPIDLITEKVIGAAYKVANALGCGLLEEVYENALAHELRKQGFHLEQQQAIDVYYDGVLVGYYISDLFVEHQLPVELKVAKALDDTHLSTSVELPKVVGLQGWAPPQFRQEQSRNQARRQ
jgi:GxxExxY protein